MQGAPLPSLGTNATLAEQLDQIADFYSTSDPRTPDQYREGVYRTAAANIRRLTVPITSGSQARNLIPRGIGQSLMEDIDGFLQTGTVPRLEILRAGGVPSRRRSRRGDGTPVVPQPIPTAPPSEEEQVLKLFESVYGIGSVKARKLYEQGYRTLDSIPISELTHAQQVGILYYFHFQVPIPRTEMDLIRDRVGRYLNPYGIRWEIAGSYRRGCPTSGDVDILVQETPVRDPGSGLVRSLNMDDVISLLRPILVADLGKGEKKYAGVVRLGDQFNAHRIDIRLIPPASWYYALLYFTGSGDFNRNMRDFAARHKNYLLNEYGLTDHTNPQLQFPASSEEDIFRYLGLQYIPPANRTPDAPLHHL